MAVNFRRRAFRRIIEGGSHEDSRARFGPLMSNVANKQYDAFLSHSHDDADWVQQLAQRLEDECGFKTWLDRWLLVPGGSWQQEMALGLDQAVSCVVCVGATTPSGWFLQEIERALNIQAADVNFRVIPVLLPDASTENVPQFLGLRTWADFRHGKDPEYAFHILKSGILGTAPGRWPPDAVSSNNNSSISVYERKLQELQRLRRYDVRDEVIIEYQRKILEQWFEK